LYLWNRGKRARKTHKHFGNEVRRKGSAGKNGGRGGSFLGLAGRETGFIGTLNEGRSWPIRSQSLLEGGKNKVNKTKRPSATQLPSFTIWKAGKIEQRGGIGEGSCFQNYGFWAVN